jgi:glutamine synthetase
MADGNASATTPEQVMALAEEQRVRFVNLQFTDIVGQVKSVTIPLHQLAECFRNGKWFDGSSIEGFARIAESDMFLVPDPTTFAVLPWERDERGVTARVICDVFNPDGGPFEGDPRHILRRAVMAANRHGFDFMTGPELEFFLFHADDIEQGRYRTYDQAGYFDLSTDTASNIRKDMVNALEELGILVETSHHEVALGQHEIDFEYSDALRTADSAITLKYCLKAIAQQHGIYATFMPKPLTGVNGSGMHTHQSLFLSGTTTNAFHDPNDDYNLSPLARQFVAGQLRHARAMCAILAPTVNSYKRLVPGYEAPVYLSWARTNRSALIRIPKIHAGKAGAARVELRCPDPACNPYLAFAVMLRCGLDGIERQLEPPAPVEEDVYHFSPEQLRARNLGTLPGSLGEALEELRRDELVRDTLGSHVLERFIEAKSSEWDDYRLQVTPWELARYLPVH